MFATVFPCITNKEVLRNIQGTVYQSMIRKPLFFYIIFALCFASNRGKSNIASPYAYGRVGATTY